MFRPLLRTTTLRRVLLHTRAPIRTRPYTSTPPTKPTTPTSPVPNQSTTAPSPRIARLLSRTPTFLHRHILALSTAPISHITSFLLLHELTAIIPLFSLAAYFHYTHWLPSWFAEGAWVLAGVEKFGRYFRRKGWIGEEERREAGHLVVEAQEHQRDGVVEHEHGEKTGGTMGRKDRAWNVGESSVRIVVEFATAYAITKALFVPRIMFSVWATPAFARWTVVPVMRWAGSMFGAGKKG